MSPDEFIEALPLDPRIFRLAVMMGTIKGGRANIITGHWKTLYEAHRSSPLAIALREYIWDAFPSYITKGDICTSGPGDAFAQ